MRRRETLKTLIMCLEFRQTLETQFFSVLAAMRQSYTRITKHAAERAILFLQYHRGTLLVRTR